MAKRKSSSAPNHFYRVSEIVVPEQFFHPLKTQSPELDAVFSELGGIIPSQVTLVTGNPGSGKTTLCAVVGSRLSLTQPKPVVFLSYEMSDFQLKTQARKIPGFDKLLISTHEFHGAAEGMDPLFKALDSIDPALVIVDSLQKMASKMPQGPTRGQIVLVEAFTKWAKKRFTPVLLIGHNGKGGDYAGPSFLKHEVDSHMTVWYDKETSERMFSMSKNRFGGNMEQYGFRINADGVHIGGDWWHAAAGADAGDVADCVADFRNNRPDWERFKKSATTLLHHLNTKHAERLRKESFIGDPKKVQIKWDGRRFCCKYSTGEIWLGRKFYEAIVQNGGTIGYRSEQPYLKRFIPTPNVQQALLWGVIHEWVHLFKGCQKHNSTMWREISKIAAEESYIWA